MDSNRPEPVKLYKYKYVYQERESHEEIPGVNWYTLTQAEYDTYVVSYINSGTYGFEDGIFGEDCELVFEDFSEATVDEQEAYNEGFIEGSMLANAQHRWDNFNGVMYRLDSMSPEFVSTKIFTCGSCDRQLEFTEVARSGEFYVVVPKENKNEDLEPTLWHVCKGCSND